MAKMTPREAMKKALDERLVGLAGKVSDVLRFKYGWNYAKQVELVKELGYKESYWEELMYEAEWEEGHG